jgi:uncharacterized protein with PQ loop repeat
MPLFQKHELATKEEKNLSVITFWLFVVATFAWVIPFTVLFVLQLTTQTVGRAISGALMPSIVTFIVTSVLCALVYMAYRKVFLKI